MIKLSVIKKGKIDRPVAYFDEPETLRICLTTLMSHYSEKGELLMIEPCVDKVLFKKNQEVVRVYYENKGTVLYAATVAYFEDEITYDLCFDALVKDARKHRMIVTESVSPEAEETEEPVKEGYDEFEELGG